MTPMRSSVPLFDELAVSYDDHFAEPHRRAYDELAWERVASLLPESPGVVIDAGCGIGRWAKRFLALKHRVIGIENAPAMAAAAREGIRDPHFRLVEGPMDSVELVDGTTADVVVAMGSLQYTPDPEKMIERFAAWLHPGGSVCVLVDSLVALVIELLRRGREAEALTRLSTRRGTWEHSLGLADLHLLDRARLEAAFGRAGLTEVKSCGLLVGVSVLGRKEVIERLESDWDGQLEFERSLAADPLLADLGKQLLVYGRRR